MKWIVTKDREDVCRHRAKKVAEEKYGHILMEMQQLALSSDRLPTEISYRYQKIRDLISSYEDDMYNHFIENYESADDVLSSQVSSPEFKFEKLALSLKDSSDVLRSDEARRASESASKKSLDFGSALDILNKKIS